MHPKQKGELVEQIILTEFMKLGIACSKPVGDNQPYDLIIDVKGKLYKVQCRKARYNSNSSITFNCLSCRISMTRIYQTDNRSKFDLFATCLLEQPYTVYIVNSKKVKTNCFTAAFNNSRLKNVNKLENYTLTKWLSKR